MAELKRAMGTLSEEEFVAAAKFHPRMDVKHVAVARAFLVRPGRLQILIAEDFSISKQLVQRHCRKLYAAHCNLKNQRQESVMDRAS